MYKDQESKKLACVNDDLCIITLDITLGQENWLLGNFKS